MERHPRSGIRGFTPFEIGCEIHPLVHLRARFRTGFTLLETMLVVTLISTLAGGILFGANQFRQGSDLELSETIIAHAMREARFFAQAGRLDDSWGINISSDRVTVFRGTSYAGRLPEYDEEIAFPSPIEISGASEIIFGRRSGLPNTEGSVTLHNESDSSTLIVNDLGIVLIEP